MTNGDIDTGEAALRGYVQGQTWKAAFIQEQVFRDGAIDAIRAADQSADKTPAGKQAAAQAALRAALNAVGYGAQVNDQQCHDGAAVVLAAVNTSRATV